VGGGIAGLSAAQWLSEMASTLSVCLLEAETCGAGASGRSSGFITPDSELELKDLVRRFW
jgi:glycine/D-amino acid oxidase-like deaminating enzyme